MPTRISFYTSRDIVVKSASGDVLRVSKNLRGMRDYARTSHPVRVELKKGDSGSTERGLLSLTYADGATCRASFASYHIMVDHVRKSRFMRGADVVFMPDSPDVGYLTRPGILNVGVK